MGVSGGERLPAGLGNELPAIPEVSQGVQDVFQSQKTDLNVYDGKSPGFPSCYAV